MANTLTNVVPQILAQGLLALRGATIGPRLVNTDYSRQAAEKGDTIDVPIPSAISAAAVAASNTAPSTADISPTKVQIPLDKWYEAPFYMTDKDINDAMNGIVPMQVSEAVKALGEQVNSDVLALYKGVYGAVGTAGTTPFASNYSAATAARKKLNEQLAPLSPRAILIDPDAEENAINLSTFADAGFTTDAGVIMDGVIGRKLGFNWFMDQQVPTHTAGTASGTLVNSASVAIGDTTVATDTGTGTILEGDIFTVAGDSQQYVCTADVADVSSGSLAFSPAAKVAWADNAAITVETTDSVANMAFHRDAFALATRPLAAPGDGLGNIIQSAVDPVSGLSLRLEISREHKRTRWSFDILYGVKTVRPELATRIYG